ncbi:MAG: LPS export ABC transporter permease LptG [Pseudomonadota bacterium]
MSLTLSLYIARRFLAIAGASFLAVLSLVVVINLVELIRSNSDGTAGFADLVAMAFLKAPSVTIAAAPFTVLLAAMTAFAWLARSSELVVTRAAGISVWALVAPALVASSVLGVFAFSVYNPLASAFAGRFEALEERYFGRSSSSLSVSEDGLWLRQGDETGQIVIRSARASGTVERMWDVSVFMFDTSDRFYRRMEARSAILEDRAWRLTGVRSWDLPPASLDTDSAGTVARIRDELRIRTDLTPERIQESFAPPETISFWALPDFIRVLEDSGFSSSRHRLHWHSLISAPIVFAAMVLVGASFSMRHARFGGLGYMALGCVMTGFGYFFLSDIATALGASGAVPIELAAWGPPASAVLFSLGLLLHFEDG